MRKNDNEVTRLDPRIVRRLRGLGAGIRARLFWRGVGWLVVGALGAAALSLIVDYGIYRATLQHLTALQRLLIDGLLLAGVLAVAVKRLVRPVSNAFDEDDLAVVIERANPELEDRLISALQFSRPGGRPPGDVSSELIERVVQQANEAGRTLQFSAVLRAGPARRALGWAFAGLAAAAALGAWQADLTAAWARRNLLLKDVKYPRRTTLSVDGGNPQRVVRGGALTVCVRADPRRVVPSDVTFHMRFPSLGDLVESVKAAADDRTRFVKHFPSVIEPFTFFVTGNDDRTERVRVELVEPPSLADVRFVITAPSYMRVEPLELHATQGALRVPDGSKVTLVGQATKDLAGATLFLDDAPAGRCRLVPPEPGGRPRALEGELQITAPVPFRPRLNLRIALTDTQGFENPGAAVFHILLVQDTPPAIVLDPLGMGGQISSRARVPLSATAKDDYGVAQVQLEWSVQSSPRNVLVNDVKDYSPPVKDPPPVQGIFDLQELAALATSNSPPLQVGETIRIQMAAIDSLPANVGTNRVLSNMVTFRIVTDDEVLSALVDSQRTMREQLRQIIALQMEVRDRCRTAIDHTVKETTLGLAHHEVVKCADAEQQVKDQLAATTERLEQLLDRIRNNRIVAQADERRMQTSVIAPLKKAQIDYVAHLTEQFQAAKAIRDGEPLATRLQETIAVQDDLINLLEAIVAEMIKVENAQQVERGLRTIIKLSDKVRSIVRAPGGDEAPETGKPAPENGGAGREDTP